MSKSSRKSKKKVGPVSSRKKTKKINYKDDYIPNYKINFGPAFATLELDLKKKQSVFAEGGVYNRMDDSVEMKTSTRGGIWKGLKRALFTSNTLFLNTFTGLSSIENKLVLASHLPGDILPMRIEPGQSIVTCNHAFLGASHNIAPPDTRFRGKNMFLGASMFLTELKVDKKYDNSGIAWISSYGPYKKISLKKGEIHLVDGGLFLCADGDVRFKVVKPSAKQGYIKSTLLSGEGFSMMFEGPCEFYVSGRNLRQFIHFIEKHIPTQTKEIVRESPYRGHHGHHGHHHNFGKNIAALF